MPRPNHIASFLLNAPEASMSAREIIWQTEKADALPMEEPAVLIITVKWVFLGTAKLSA